MRFSSTLRITIGPFSHDLQQVQCAEEMSQCKKFAPNIFHKTKCSNCFRQKEEHSAEALECNRASRSIARSGYLFVAPDWDFSVPLNRTKRWQRRWFVLYDDGELNYSVDEHPDTVPQGSVDMSKVLEVTGAEQVTGHPHSLALTSPDRVTFVKAASREDARWWAELLAVFPRRHKRNATFPGGRASPSLPQLGRSASPQPPRPRHLSVSGPSPRTNFETPPLKEERESPPKDANSRSATWMPERTGSVLIENVQQTNPVRNDYIVSSGSPPTRDKLRCDDKARVRRDWRNERLRDIATALTDRSPESSLALPSEGLLHLKKGWLFLKNSESEWARRWIVLCGPSLNVYQDQDEQTTPELIVELSTVTNYFSEIATNDSKYGFEIQYSGQKKLILSALTQGIRSNWLQALKKAALPNNINNNNNNTINSSAESPTTPSTPRSVLLSSDEEYRTASEGGRRGSEDWSELPPSPPLTRLALNRVKDRSRLRPRLPRCQSRQSTLDSTSTDELDCAKDAENFEMQHNSINNKNHGVIVGEVEELQKQWAKALSEIQHLQDEIARLNKIQSEAVNREKNAKEMLELLERNEKELNQRNVQMENKYKKEQKAIQRRLLECEELAKSWENKCNILSRELQTKQRIIGNLQDDLTSSNERLTHTRLDNDKLYKRVQELEGKYCYKNNNIHLDSLTDLTNIDLDLDIDELGQNELKEYCLDLKCRFEKAVLEIRAVKRELRDSHELCDHLELAKFTLTHSIELTRSENQAEIKLFVDRLDNLTAKLSAAEKQLKSKSGKSDKRRSLSLKGRENFSINKEVEDKVTELEAKILALERGGRTTKKKYSSKSRERSSERGSPIDDKSLRRLRRKSLDSATSSEPMKLLMRLSTLETKVSNSVNASNESLNVDATRARDDLIAAARIKINECLQHVNAIKRNVSLDKLSQLEQSLSELNDILKSDFSSTGEYEVINSSASGVVKQLQQLLLAKLTDLNEKKRLLQEKNEYDASAKLEMLAEKLAFENVLINRIQSAFGAPSGDRLVCKEVKETAHLIVGLQNKFNGKQSTALVCKTSADYLSKILAQYLIASARGLTVSASAKPQVNSSDLNLLRDEQRKLHNLYNNYKATKLPQIAEALATETIHLSADQTCRISVRSIGQQLSNATRDLVNAELIQSEINHILIRAAQIYQSNFDQDHTYFFTFFASERAALELWSDSVGDYLYDETNRAIGELSDLYQSALTKLQRQNFRRRVESERNSRSPSNLLHDFADIVAHKALIDARIHVLSGDSSSSSSSAMTSLADLLSENRDGSQLAVEINQSLEAEFACMLDRFNVECLRQICQPEFDEILHSLDEIATKVGDLQRCVDLPQLGDEDETSPKCWRDVCRTCRSLRDKLEEIRSAFYKRFDNFDEHQQRPVYLGTEYLTQVENLRAAYRCALASCKERHQETDIEQLQMLCERVLSSMEQWHRRTIQDLREAHAQEMEALKMDKEQALEEETQATLAALDAMRKAHEAEVQREVSRFKQEFARQQRDEILDLSERLSVKRLEAAALEEQLGNATRQLTHAQQHILQLERNP